MRRKLSFNEKHKLRLIFKAQGRSYVRHVRAYKTCARRKIISKVIPSNFKALSNQQEVFTFISELLDIHTNRKIKHIYLNMKDVVGLDSAAVCLLLSVVSELNYHGIKISGNFPDNYDCAKYLVDSGFLNHMKDSQGRNFNIDSPNFIVETGKDKTRNKVIGLSIRKAIGHLLGTFPQRYQPAYTVAMEICSNSVEHAYNDKPNLVHWKLGIHKKEDSISFTMSDTGTGILNTLHRKFWKEIKDEITFRNNSDILYRAFLRKYGSTTQLVNRNRGLPCILDKFQNKLIKNLKIITNNVYLDFNNINDRKEVNYSFPGVLFYWEVDKECIENFMNTNQES